MLLVVVLLQVLLAENAVTLRRLALVQPCLIDLYPLVMFVRLMLLVMLLVTLLVMLRLHALRLRRWRLPQGGRAGPARRKR